MNQEELDKALAICAQEPIHIPGKIQPHGLLLTFMEADGRLIQVSSNCEAILGSTPEQALTQTLEDQLTAASTERIRGALTADNLLLCNPLDIEIRTSGKKYDGILHRSNGLCVLELEPTDLAGPSDSHAFHARIRSLTHLIQSTRTLQDAFAQATGMVHDLTGFERVLIYRFDREWNGHVVGETKADDQDSFLDLHYPASDIPPQARQLYLRNWLRIIPDALYEPAALVPEMNPLTGEPLDLSGSVLRSVSPVHIQYLKNFGARASMSISIIKDNELWGLISCTDRQARYVPYAQRTLCEFIGQALSVHLIKLESQDIYEQKLKTHSIKAHLLRNVVQQGVAKGLVESKPNLLDLISSGGAALMVGEEINLCGATPGLAELKSLRTWLQQNQKENESIFHADDLPRVYPPAQAFKAVACGVLAATVDAIQGHFILWFRPEIIETVKWGGNPHKAVEQDGARHLTPRKSFEIWKEALHMRAEPWQAWELESADDLRRGVVDVIQHKEMQKINAALEARSANLEKLNQAKDDFLAVVSHELRSPLNVIVGYAELLRFEEQGTPEFDHAIDAITRNAKTQAQLIADLLDVSRIITGKLSLDFSVVSISELVVDATDSVRFSAQAKGVTLQTDVDPNLTSIAGDHGRLKQVLWNLLSNAIKFTPEGGKVKLVVRRHLSMIEFCVSDTGQGINPEFLPYVFDRFRQEDIAMAKKLGGLGLGLQIVKHIAELHGGTVAAHSSGKGHGASFTVRIPMAAAVLDDGRSPHVKHMEMDQKERSTQLKGCKVLVIDDEPDARQLLQTLLERAGAKVMVAQSAMEGLDMMSRRQPDVLLCDINLGSEEDGLKFIQTLRKMEREQGRRAIPSIALTAYAGALSRQELMACGFQTLLGKPVLNNELIATVCNLARQYKP
ncbi:ATP-binding protein [Oligoflexus tunisiensis]|uniref:ATP-binding protein n=1 Tax=Oligoflexus tunisiensis TaxID=708132 RepID=UPI000A7F6252|nr:ATP-binding protein [Oligoflexus tunisiensis]